MSALPDMTKRNAEPVRKLLFMRLADLTFKPTKTTRAFAESIRNNGVLEPLLVGRRVEAGPGTVVLDGRRRASAALEAGVESVPVYLVSGTPEQCEAWTIITNLHRSRNVASELKALRALAKTGADRESIEAQLGLYRKDSKRLFALLSLAPEVEALLAEGRLQPSTAMVLAGLTPAQQRTFLAEMGEGKPTLAAAKNYRMRIQYAPSQLSFLSAPIPEIKVELP